MAKSKKRCAHPGCGRPARRVVQKDDTNNQLGRKHECCVGSGCCVGQMARRTGETR